LSLADPVPGIDKPIIIRFADGKVKAGPDAVSAIPTLFVKSNKTYLDILNRLILLYNTPDSFSAGRLRVITATHIFDHQVAPASAYHLFAQAGRCGGAHLAIHTQSGADERRIAHPSVHLPGRPAG